MFKWFMILVLYFVVLSIVSEPKGMSLHPPWTSVRDQMPEFSYLSQVHFPYLCAPLRIPKGEIPKKERSWDTRSEKTGWADPDRTSPSGINDRLSRPPPLTVTQSLTLLTKTICWQKLEPYTSDYMQARQSTKRNDSEGSSTTDMKSLWKLYRRIESEYERPGWKIQVTLRQG